MATMPQIVFNEDGTWYEIETWTVEDLEAFFADKDPADIIDQMKQS